jgi:hypothetical protein
MNSDLAYYLLFLYLRSLTLHHSVFVRILSSALISCNLPRHLLSLFARNGTKNVIRIR